MRDGRPFALARLWERWHGAEGEPIESRTIITRRRTTCYASSSTACR
jgi:putative SOS response-associated peptidase YedK